MLIPMEETMIRLTEVVRNYMPGETPFSSGVVTREERQVWIRPDDISRIEGKCKESDWYICSVVLKSGRKLDVLEAPQYVLSEAGLG